MKRKALNAVAISSVLLLALSACGSDSESTNTTPDTQDNTNVSDSIATYTIGDTTTAESAQEVRIDVSRDLIEADQYYADHRALDAIIIRAADVPDAQCGVEYEFQYATGAVEELDKHDHQKVQRVDEGSSAEDREFALETHDERTKYSLATVSSSRYADDPNMGFNSDYTTYRTAVDCATNPSDADAVEDIRFRTFEWNSAVEQRVKNSEEGPQRDQLRAEMTALQDAQELIPQDFAEVEFTVMANGDIQIISSSVEGWTQDSNGMWLED